MPDNVQTKRQLVSAVGVNTGTVSVYRCTYCGNHVTGSSPNYLQEAGPPNVGGPYACPARGGTQPHVTH